MNNAYFAKNNKLQTRNRAGMIRSYRTSRTCAEMLMLILDMILFSLDRGFDVLCRPTVRRVLRGGVAIGCIVSFIFVIAAIDNGAIALASALLIAMVLVVLEIFCLRGN